MALVGAYSIGNELVWSAAFQDLRQGSSIPLAIFAVALLVYRGIYRIKPRYMGLYDVANILLVGAVSTLALTCAELLNGHRDFRHWFLIPFIFGCLVGGLLVGVRLIRRGIENRRLVKSSSGRRPKKVLIIGAGDAGELVIREISRSPQAQYLPVGFLDDDPNKKDLMIHGVPVLGKSSDLPTISKDYAIDEALVAIPSASGQFIRTIMNLCESAGVSIRTLPPVAEMLQQGTRIRHQLREVQIEDLLRREPVHTDPEIPRQYLGGETVLITGAGGSIGSELARQIALMNPSTLVLLGRGENSIFEIEQELIALGLHPVAIIADIRDRQSVEAVFERYRPSVVFHAAAHKHVPLMQANVAEAIKNNVRGTHIVVELAVRFGVRKFVYISTDKAVNPSNVMGATKRVGEILVRSFAGRSETEFAIVRFGNVLGSRGSLVPILHKQIRRGGPIRLTHPDMTRYFMTIPEAVQLILQAGAMGRDGELFILDMGEPVRIVDIAKDLIRLHGLVPGEDIEVTFTGIRPGEKLNEELVYAQELLQETAHAKVKMVQGDRGPDHSTLISGLDHLYELAEAGGDSERLRQELMTMGWGKDQPPFRYAVVEADQLKSESVSEDLGPAK